MVAIAGWLAQETAGFVNRFVVDVVHVFVLVFVTAWLVCQEVQDPVARKGVLRNRGISLEGW